MLSHWSWSAWNSSVNINKQKEPNSASSARENALSVYIIFESSFPEDMKKVFRETLNKWINMYKYYIFYSKYATRIFPKASQELIVLLVESKNIYN